MTEAALLLMVVRLVGLLMAMVVLDVMVAMVAMMPMPMPMPMLVLVLVLVLLLSELRTSCHRGGHLRPILELCSAATL